MRIRKHRVGFYNQLELFLVAALGHVISTVPHNTKNSSEVVAAPCLDDA